MTREQLKANGWIEDTPGHFIKGCDVRIPTPDHQITVGGIEKPIPKRIRQSSKPLLNKLETEYYERIKDKFPNYPPVRPQAKRYRIANGVTLTPDLTCSLWPAENSYARETCWEVKGPHAWEDSLIKLKMAAAAWPEIQWILAWKVEGVWQEQRILP